MKIVHVIGTQYKIFAQTFTLHGLCHRHQSSKQIHAQAQQLYYLKQLTNIRSVMITFHSLFGSTQRT